MILTNAQNLTLKADITANAGALGNAIIERNGPLIAAFYNAIASPDFFVWQTKAPVSLIFDSINWDKFTQADPADSTVLQSNRLLIVQTKQMNLQNMLIGRDTIDASKVNIRAGLRDATTALPTGAAGAVISASGASAATLLTALLRKATVLEKLLNVGSATTGAVTGNLLGVEGAISGDQILVAMDS